jgi:EmrB/QacA subfamily drug resistance transporter
MTRTQRWTLTVVCAATAMLMLDIAVVNTALSDIAADLDTGLSGLQWVVDAYTLALAATVLTAGSLADRIGRRKLFLAGLAVFTVTSGLCAAATDITMLNVSRAAQGLGASIMFAVSLAVLSHAFPQPGERAKALAAYGASIGAAFAIGPAVGGALTSGLDWRWIFLVNIPLGLACLAITHRFVVESRDPNARRIDWSGQALLIVGLFVLVLALLRGNEDGWGSPLIVSLLAGSIAALVAFIAVERRSPHAMLPLKLFRNPDFTGAQVAAFAISATFFAVFIYMTLYLQQILGLSAIEAGLVYLPGTIVMFFVSGATAALGEKVSAKAMIVGGLVLVAAGMGWIAMVAEVGSSWTAFLPGSIVAMIGSGLFNPALSAVALGSVPTEQSGLAAGVNDTFRQAGIAVGVAALGALIPAAPGLGGNPADYVAGLHDALLVGGVFAIAGGIAAAFLIKGKEKAPALNPALQGA